MIELQYVKTDCIHNTQQIFRCSKPITKSLEYDDIKTHLEVYKERLECYLDRVDILTIISAETNKTIPMPEEHKKGIFSQYEWVKEKLENEDYSITDILVSKGHCENCIFSVFTFDYYKDSYIFDCALSGGWTSKLQYETKSGLIDALMKANFGDEPYEIIGWNY